MSELKDPAVLARLEAIEQEFLDLEAQLADSGTTVDSGQLRIRAQRYHELAPVVSALNRLRERSEDLLTAREMLPDTSGEDRAMVQAEIDGALAEIELLGTELREALVPPDPHAGRAVIMEIRGAEGGEEANLFAGDLYEMYLAYAARRGWKTETLSRDHSDLGGLNQVTFVVRGADAWRRLKFEGGPHRVQRVPVTESQGRIHTSSATVAVLPEVDEIEVIIDERDLDIDVYRASGPGGQSVNTTDSAVRITHRPTGLVVAMQDERSQLQNRARAMQVLRARLFERLEREREAEMSADRKSQVGGGGRSEKIRTYNFKESRVTDHRIGFTIHRLNEVLAGDLDPVIDALTAEERLRQLQEGVDG
jgi:peptide chain release factor 1